MHSSSVTALGARALGTWLLPLPAASLSTKWGGKEREGWAGYRQGQFLARAFGVALEASLLSIREQVGEGGLRALI